MRRVLLTSAAVVGLSAACVQFEESTETADTSSPVPDTSVTTPDTGGGSDDADATPADGSTEPVELAAVYGNNLGQEYAEPVACGEQTIAFPVDFQSCAEAWQPPFWQLPGTGSLASGMNHLSESCAGSGSDAPSGVHLSFPYTDASTSMAVVWTTSAGNTFSDVQFGTSPEELTSSARGVSFDYGALERSDRRAHEVRLCGLQPATTYYYRAGGGESWSGTYSFTTAPAADSEASFRLAVTGDSRNETQSLLGSALDGILERDADLMVFTGDAVQDGADQSQWDVFFEQAAPTATSDRMASLPWIFVHGNHELLGDPSWALNSQPRNEQNFAIRYGNTIFISLDDTGGFLTQELSGGLARDFLVETLEANSDATWRIVSHHKPMYSCGTRHGQDFGLLDDWATVFDQYGVDFVFNGHEHNYERSAPIRGNERASNGTVYVVAAGIGAPLYDIETNCFWTERAEKIPTYVILDITETTISATTYDLQGGVVDTFSRTASDR
jgi:3',5'-cyclic AMP phosphodiesterase CpdA